MYKSDHVLYMYNYKMLQHVFFSQQYCVLYMYMLLCTNTLP